MQSDAQQPAAKRPPGTKLGVHPIRRPWQYGAAKAMVAGPAGGVPPESTMRYHADRSMSIKYETSCPRCHLVFGHDSDGEFEDSATDSTLGSDESTDEGQGVLQQD